MNNVAGTRLQIRNGEIRMRSRRVRTRDGGLAVVLTTQTAK